jgi:hypothetical protein
MPEQYGPGHDHKQLLLADGLLGLGALEKSLQAATSVGSEAALYLADLASILSGLGLKSEAMVLKGLSTTAAEDPDSTAVTLARQLSPLRDLLSALQEDDVQAVERARQSLASCVQRPGDARAASSAGVSAAAQASPFVSMALQPSTAAEPMQGLLVDFIEEDPPPLFSAGLASGPFAQAMQTAAVASPHGLHAQHDWSGLRTQLMEGVQEAGGWVLAQSTVPSAVLLRLQATQDSLVRVGQLPLQQVYPDVPQAAECWVDRAVLEVLDHLAIFSRRARQVAVEVRNLTLFVHWRDASLTQAEIAHAADRVAELQGRLEIHEAALQLVMPVSTFRMRMVPFVDGGQWHAVPWAQVLGIAADGRLRLQNGLRVDDRLVEQTAQATNMNLYPWPTAVPAAAGVSALALDATGRLHLVRRL